MRMQAVRFIGRSIAIPEDIGVTVGKLVVIRIPGPCFKMSRAVASALIVNGQIDIVVVKVVEPQPLLLVPRKGSGSSVGIRIFRKGMMGTVRCVVALQRATDACPFLRL